MCPRFFFFFFFRTLSTTRSNQPWTDCSHHFRVNIDSVVCFVFNIYMECDHVFQLLEWWRRGSWVAENLHRLHLHLRRLTSPRSAHLRLRYRLVSRTWTLLFGVLRFFTMETQARQDPRPEDPQCWTERSRPFHRANRLRPAVSDIEKQRQKIGMWWFWIILLSVVTTVPNTEWYFNTTGRRDITPAASTAGITAMDKPPVVGKPPVPAAKPQKAHERKPPPEGAPPPPPPGSRLTLMKQSSSFTTEDMDLFGSEFSAFVFHGQMKTSEKIVYFDAAIDKFWPQGALVPISWKLCSGWFPFVLSFMQKRGKTAATAHRTWVHCDDRGKTETTLQREWSGKKSADPNLREPSLALVPSPNSPPVPNLKVQFHLLSRETFKQKDSDSTLVAQWK